MTPEPAKGPKLFQEYLKRMEGIETEIPDTLVSSEAVSKFLLAIKFMLDDLAREVQRLKEKEKEETCQEYFVVLSHANRGGRKYEEDRVVVRAESAWEAFGLSEKECRKKEKEDKEPWVVYDMRRI